MSEAPDFLRSMAIDSMNQLVASALALGAEEIGPLSPAERRLAQRVPRRAPRVDAIAEAIRAGNDPLGDAFCCLRAAVDRRSTGQTFTPRELVEPMIRWSGLGDPPTRVVDPGVGSGRYLVAAGRRHPAATLIGIDIDPIATLMARANLAVSGLADRSQIRLADYRSLRLPKAYGSTLFIGNPPYVRHHDISAGWKQWLTDTARGFGYRASKLAGLHVYFFLRRWLRRSLETPGPLLPLRNG